MIDEEVMRLRVHDRNMDRYRWLLDTKLSDIERQYIEKRLTEEKSAVERLTAAKRQDGSGTEYRVR